MLDNAKNKRYNSKYAARILRIKQPIATPFNLFRLVIKKERRKDHEEQYAGIVSQTP